MLGEVDAPFPQYLHVLCSVDLSQLLAGLDLWTSAMDFERADGGDDDYDVWDKARGAAVS